MGCVPDVAPGTPALFICPNQPPAEEAIERYPGIIRELRAPASPRAVVGVVTARPVGDPRVVDAVVHDGGGGNRERDEEGAAHGGP